MATAPKDRTATSTKATKRSHIGSLKLEEQAVERSIGHFIPERWRDLVAIVLIFVSLLVFFRGVLDSQHTFNNGDNIASDSFKPFLEDAKKQGYDMPQWIPNIFSGMPAFAALVTTGARSYDVMHGLFDVVQSLPQALSPNTDAMTHIWHYFILGLGMYLLLRVTRNTSRLVALFGAFSAIFSTWIITYVMIGHNTKIFAVMTMPYIFMSIEKLRTPKMHWQSIVLWCAVLATSFHFLLESTHAQMIFYMCLAVLLYFIVSLITDLIRKHNIAPLFRSGILALLMVGFAFAMSADRYLATFAYEPYSIRGTPPIQDNATPATENKASANHATDAGGGLDWTYATNWSFSPQEVITFLVPGWYGFGKVQYDGPEVQTPTTVETYWGQAPNTDAANYTGIIVFLLAIIAMLTLWKRDRLVAPLGVISIFAVLLSFGGNMPVLFGPMFHYFPTFNKFRAPMMALVLMQLCFPILAALAFEEILRVWKLRNQHEDNRLQSTFKKAMYVAGALLAITIIGRGAITSALHDGIAHSQKQTPIQLADWVATLGANDALIGMLFATAACALVFFFLKRRVTPLIFGVALFVLSAADLWRIDNRPMSLTTRDEYQSRLDQPDYAQFIKQDKSLYRIMDLNEPVSNVPASWGAQTIAGYHAAKMRSYQDVVDVTGNMGGNGIYNPFMYNLLNTKYIIANGGISEDQSRFVPVFQSKTPTPAENGKPGQPTVVWMNPQALPRMFFVNRYEVKPKLDILHAMKDGSFNPRDVVYFDEAPKDLGAIATTPVDTSSEGLQITSYKNEDVVLRTNTKADHLLFMSDTWYPDWNATIDGKSTTIYKADYAFRAIRVPAGSHEVKFNYYDPHFETGRSVSLMTNLLALIGLAVGLSSIYFVRRKRVPEVEVLPVA